MVVLITYDLNKIKDYLKLYKAIEQLGETKRDPGLDSVWFVRTDYTMQEIINYLFINTDPDDRIYATRVYDSQSGGRISDDLIDWISNNLL